MGTFLADTIPRNRPRVVYFSRSPTPSLAYHLGALYLHSTLDFAYCTTMPGSEGAKVSRRFGVVHGEEKLLVFKEDHAPILEQEVNGSWDSFFLII